MTALLASTTATSPTATEGNVKTYLANLRDVIAGYLGTDTANKALALATLGSSLNGSLAKTSSYTVVEDDRGKVITYSGAGGVTLSLSAVATLRDGFVFAIANNASSNITIDPNLSETIDGATTYTVKPTETVIVFCDGAKWILFGKAPPSPVVVSKFNNRTGDVTLTSSDVTTALGFTPPSKDVGAAAIGAFCFGVNQSSTFISSGDIVPGSFVGLGSGSWRNVQPNTISPGGSAIYQRVS